VLLADGSVVASDQEIQAKFDTLKDSGVIITSVNRIIVDEAGNKYNPVTIDPITTDYLSFYPGGLIKKSNNPAAPFV